MTRNQTIVRNAFALPGLMSPALQRILGQDMISAARYDGQYPRMPENFANHGEMTGHAPIIIRILQSSDSPMTRADIAKAMGMDACNINTALSRLRERKLITAELLPNRKFRYTFVEAAQ